LRLAGRGLSHEQLQQLEQVATTTAARDEGLRHVRRLALAQCIDDGHGSGLTRTDGVTLRLVSSRLALTEGSGGGAVGFTDGTDLGSLTGTELLQDLAVTGRLGHGSFGVRPVDLDRDLGGGLLLLHVSLTLHRLHVDARVLGVLLGAVRLLLLVGDFSGSENLGEVIGKSDVLDVDAAHLDEVLVEVLLDVLGGLLLNAAAGLDEVRCRKLGERVAEVVANRGLKDLVHQLGDRLHRPDHLGGVRVGDVDLDLQFDRELERVVRLRNDGAELPVEAVLGLDVVGPVELQDAGGDDDRLVDGLVETLLAGADHIRPDAFVTGCHDGSELVRLTGLVLSRQADVRLDDRDLALLDHQHGLEVDLEQEGVDGVVTRTQHVMLKASAASRIQERLGVLVVVVQCVVVAEHRLDDLIRGSVGRLQRADVIEATDAAGNRSRLERRTVERGEDANLVGGDGDVVQVLALCELNHLLGVTVDGSPIGTVDRHHDEGIGVDGVGTRGEHVTLDALLATVVDEGLDVLKVAVLGLVGRARRSRRNRCSHLGDDDAEGLVRDADDRHLAVAEHRPQTKVRAGREGTWLDAVLAVERDEAVVFERLPAEVLREKGVVALTYEHEALREDEQDDENDQSDHDEHR